MVDVLTKDVFYKNQMKRKLPISISAAAAPVRTFMAPVEDTANPKTDGQNQTS
jgi:hypothetical protein